MSRTKKVTLPPYRVGGPIEIGISNGSATNWMKGTIVSMDLGDPMVVQSEDGTLMTEGIDFKFKKAVAGPAKIQMEDLPPEIAAPLYKKALVDILKETNTKSPNATVQRVIHIVKEALGELDS